MVVAAGGIGADSDAGSPPTPATPASLAAIVRAAGAWRAVEGRGNGSRHMMHRSASDMMLMSDLIAQAVF